MTRPVRFTIINACASSRRVLVAADPADTDGMPLHDRAIAPAQRSCFHLAPGGTILVLDASAGGSVQRYTAPASTRDVTVMLRPGGLFVFDPPSA